MFPSGAPQHFMSDITVSRDEFFSNADTEGTSGRTEIRPGGPRPFIFYQHIPEPGYSWALGHSPLAESERWPHEEMEQDLSEINPKPEWAIIRPFVVMPYKTGGGARFDYRGPHRTVRPLLDSPALFREFAGLEVGDRDAILAFANKYGQLSFGTIFFPREIPEQLVSHLTKPEVEFLIEYVTGRRPRESLDHVGVRPFPNRPNLFVHRAETESFWNEAISDMKQAVRLWSSISEGDIAEITSIRSIFRPTKTSTPEELIAFGFNYLAEVVNRELWRRVQPDLVIDPSALTPVLRFYPDDLLRAMWLQFAQAIAGNKTQRMCVCGNWFEISAADDGRTTRRMFCSDPCKSRDYRRRKALAESLHQSGATPEEIAASTGTDVSTIRQWLGIPVPKKKRRK